MVELIDTSDLGSDAERREGLSPSTRTKWPNGEIGRRDGLKIHFFGVRIRLPLGLPRHSVRVVRWRSAKLFTSVQIWSVLQIKCPVFSTINWTKWRVNLYWVKACLLSNAMVKHYGSSPFPSSNGRWIVWEHILVLKTSGTFGYGDQHLLLPQMG